MAAPAGRQTTQPVFGRIHRNAAPAGTKSAINDFLVVIFSCVRALACAPLHKV